MLLPRNFVGVLGAWRPACSQSFSLATSLRLEISRNHGTLFGRLRLGEVDLLALENVQKAKRLSHDLGVG